MMATKRIVSNEAAVLEIKKLVDLGNDVIFSPKGVSMLPFIRGGWDKVLLKKLDSLNVFDIVLAKTNDGNYVIHRIESIDGERITLMGDGNLSDRESCDGDNIIAVVTKIIKPNSVIDCCSASHRMKARIWKLLLPVRKYLLTIYKCFLKINI